MGTYLALAAFKGASESAVRAVLDQFLLTRDLGYEPCRADFWDGSSDFRVNPESGGWCMVEWGGLRVDGDSMTEYLSRELRTLAAYVQINHSDTWTHRAFQDGELLDMYNSWPDFEVAAWEYITGDEFPVEEMKSRWRGSPERLARAFEADPGILALYLVYHGHESFNPEAKAMPDDTHSLGDEWLIVDFWRRLGIPWLPEKNWEKPWYRLVDRRERAPG